jgi:hypothetical protein
VEAGKLVTVENVPRPKPTLTEHKEDVAKRVRQSFPDPVSEVLDCGTFRLWAIKIDF